MFHWKWQLFHATARAVIETISFPLMEVIDDDDDDDDDGDGDDDIRSNKFKGFNKKSSISKLDPNYRIIWIYN